MRLPAANSDPQAVGVEIARHDGRERIATRIRVASVPANHVYVRHLADHYGDDSVVRLPDPVPTASEKVPWGWWPPAMLEPGWAMEHADEFDIFHIHFGFDQCIPAEMARLVETLRELRKPLVYTVHDLRNPHHNDRGPHERVLDVLIPAADAVITLSTGAADEIRRRWEREALVLPHPHVLELRQLGQPRMRSAEFVIGIHLKSFRANMDPIATVEAVADAVHRLPATRLRVDMHDEVEDPDNYWYRPEIAKSVRRIADRQMIELRVHPYFDDDALWNYLASLDACVLPYRFGTHSGWLEACYDLGTTVIAPDCGFYADQRPVFSFSRDAGQLDAQSLAKAVRQARAQVRPWQASREERERERAFVAARHRKLYESLLDR